MKTPFQFRVMTPFVLSGLLLCGGSGAVQAQPTTPVAPAMTPDAQTKPRGRGKQKGGAQGGVPRRIFTALEAKTGQPVTPATRERLVASAKIRDAAVEAAREKYLVDFAAATGLTLDEARELNKPVKRVAANGAAANGGAANGGGANADQRAERKRQRQMLRGGGAPEAPIAAPVAP